MWVPDRHDLNRSLPPTRGSLASSEAGEPLRFTASSRPRPRQASGRPGDDGVTTTAEAHLK